MPRSARTTWLLLSLLRPHIVALHEQAVTRTVAPGEDPLTPRQRELTQLVAVVGYTNGQIGTYRLVTHWLPVPLGLLAIGRPSPRRIPKLPVRVVPDSLSALVRTR